MYDIRAKQEFIFKTNHLKEIIGASGIIRDCFEDYLYPEAKKVSNGKGIFSDPSSNFTKKEFEKHLEEGYIGEVVYDGGGNFILLYKNVEIYRKVTYAFTKKVIETIGTLRVLSSYIEGVLFEHYDKDHERLYQIHAINESQESNIGPWGTLPIVQVDNRTSLPLVDKVRNGNKIEKVSKESLAKYKKYYEMQKKAKDNGFDEKEIDKLVLEKGKDSLLAIVYIDGNNMGAQVQECIKGKVTYEDCVLQLREFSKKIQKDYIDDRKKDLEHTLKNATSIYKWRLVLGAGDEINFICNAHDAYILAKTYLQELPKGCTSCAGIAIFHSHSPYSEAYKIAEECCETGKTLMKRKKISEACFIDFHYCQGAIDVSLEQIRKREGTVVSSRPWFIPTKTNEQIDNKEITSLRDVENMLCFLRLLGRSNIKGLAEKAKTSMTSLKMEIKRIIAHMNDKDKKQIKILKDENKFDIDKLTEKERKLIYDIVVVYDLWFRERKIR